MTTPNLQQGLPQLGDSIADRYRLVTVLGSGGHGVVYEALDARNGARVALKILMPEAAKRRTHVRARFMREIKIVEALDHPSIVSYHGHGAVFCDGKELLWMAMDLVEGEELGVLRARERRFEIERARNITLRVLDALAAAHAVEIVHRDLKPSNIMIVDPGGRDDVTLLDFGIGKALGGDLTHDVTRTQDTVPGTPRYMAPEILLKEEAGTWSDVYAMGLMLLEMITGTPGIEGEDLYEVIAYQLSGRVRIPSWLRESAIGDVITTACTKEWEERFPDASAFADALIGVPIEDTLVEAWRTNGPDPGEPHDSSAENGPHDRTTKPARSLEDDTLDADIDQRDESAADVSPDVHADRHTPAPTPLPAQRETPAPQPEVSVGHSDSVPHAEEPEPEPIDIFEEPEASPTRSDADIVAVDSDPEKPRFSTRNPGVRETMAAGHRRTSSRKTFWTVLGVVFVSLAGVAFAFTIALSDDPIPSDGDSSASSDGASTAPPAADRTDSEPGETPSEPVTQEIQPSSEDGVRSKRTVLSNGAANGAIGLTGDVRRPSRAPVRGEARVEQPISRDHAEARADSVRSHPDRTPEETGAPRSEAALEPADETGSPDPRQIEIQRDRADTGAQVDTDTGTGGDERPGTGGFVVIP